MGYIRGFRDGFVLGVTIGVLTAPRAGKETRDLIARTVTKTKGQAQGMADRAQQGWQVAHPALDRAAQAAADVARAVQPVAQGVADRFAELVGRGGTEPPVPGVSVPFADSGPMGFGGSN
ncbi:MAG: YtxH domain-containing protein [Candidatus Dormibacteria bacterium]|jgi:gas vesicle protein